jgi:CBS domain-containing protein
VQQFVDFLAHQSPYDSLQPDDLQRLASNVSVEFFAAGATILDPSQTGVDQIFVIRNGLVQLVDQGRVIDELGTGETFGQIALLTGLPPAVEVRAVEETLCYLIPDPRKLLEHPEHLYARYGTMKPRTTGGVATVSSEVELQRPVSRLARSVPVIRADLTIRRAAQIAADGEHTCLFVDYGDSVGIVTDTNYRVDVATGRTDLDAPVGMIAQRPLRSVPEITSTGQAFAEMLRHDIHHLAVLDSDGRPTGVLRVLDVGTAELRGPLSVRGAIERAEDLASLELAARRLPEVLLDFHDRGVPATHIAGLMSAVRDSIVHRAIALHDRDKQRLMQHSWMVLGSQARREPLPLSDIDTALIAAGNPTDADLRVLRDDADDILTTLERCGLARCPDGANATNPLFSRSREGWLTTARGWTTSPRTDTLLLTGMAADSRPVVNAELADSVLDEVATWARSRDFLHAMLKFALSNRPPTGFVRDFVVESSGRHRGQLNLKRRGLRPVVGLSQWIAIASESFQGSTVERLRRGEAAGLLTRDEADILVGAYTDMFELLFNIELEAMRSDQPTSTYIDPSTLDSLSRRHLRDSFRAIAKVQTRLEGEWVSRLG